MDFYVGWAEWDLGQDGVIFTSHKAFKQWATDRMVESGVDHTYDEAAAQGLVGSKPVTVITEAV